ncbi:MAG TPA: trypsin-like peptidase domain-containing protein [Alphaproteobacteria bacterium]|jgi:hypothetical protein|nr:trypsin-like peptidase domain-containing protein [Alphaproteobacteria bacterium]
MSEGSLPKANRRQFVKGLAAGLGLGVAAGLGIDQIFTSSTSPDKQKEEVSKSNRLGYGTPVPLSPEPEVEQVLNQTATAVIGKGETSSFVETPEFSKKLFEKVRQSTFIVEIEGHTRDATVTNIGSGWIADLHDGSKVLVTNRHHYTYVENGKVFPFEKINSIQIWRPGIDKQRVALSEFNIFKMDLPDLAVAKFNIFENVETPIEGLKYRDGVVPSKNSDILVVGYPAQFRDPTKPLWSITMGSAVKILQDFDPTRGEWYAHGPVSGGSSGSVAVIEENGEPLAIGIVFASGRGTMAQSGAANQEKNFIVGIPLSIDTLVNQ